MHIQQNVKIPNVSCRCLPNTKCQVCLTFARFCTFRRILLTILLLYCTFTAPNLMNLKLGLEVDAFINGAFNLVDSQVTDTPEN
jgi:hypothetical protein